MNSVSSWRAVMCGVLVTASFLLATTPSHASSIEFHSYGFNGSALTAIGVDPFDPAKGTLQSVDVSITGVLIVQGVTQLNQVQQGSALVPVQYLFNVTVTQDFFGLAGKYFDFSSNASFLFSGNAPGTGEAFNFVSNFGYSFTFDATSDLTGNAFPNFSSSEGILTPPLTVTGLRADFLDTIVPIDEIDLVQTWNGQSFAGVPPPIISSVNSSGALQITYHYTPVPEPSSLALLGLGASVLVFRTLRRRGR